MGISDSGKTISEHQAVQVYPEFLEARFIRRINRFVMELEMNGSTIQAYIPNTGRMSEFLVADHPFYLVKSSGGKYSYKVVSTIYQGNYVFLDTVKVNDIFDQLLKNGVLNSLFPHLQSIKREYSILNSRFDFCVENTTGSCSMVEVKSCTLVHNQNAMFPDAPTLRGQKHVRELQTLSEKEYDCHVIFLIMNGSASCFFPNFHTDYEYGQEFLLASNVKFHALTLNLSDPVTIVLDNVRDIPIDRDILSTNCINKGNYLLVLENDRNFSRGIGRLDIIDFPKGFYVYVGSAMHSLDSRIKRHYSKRKQTHWHIDYLTPQYMIIKKSFPIRRAVSIESTLAGRLKLIAHRYIPGFGSSDTGDPSHLFYFQENPIHQREFLNLLFDAYTFTL